MYLVQNVLTESSFDLNLKIQLLARMIINTKAVSCFNQFLKITSDPFELIEAELFGSRFPCNCAFYTRNSERIVLSSDEELITILVHACCDINIRFPARSIHSSVVLYYNFTKSLFTLSCHWLLKMHAHPWKWYVVQYFSSWF